MVELDETETEAIESVIEEYFRQFVDKKGISPNELATVIKDKADREVELRK